MGHASDAGVGALFVGRAQDLGAVFATLDLAASVLGAVHVEAVGAGCSEADWWVGIEAVGHRWVGHRWKPPDRGDRQGGGARTERSAHRRET